MSAVSIESPSKPRVLIVDDSRIVRATLVKAMDGVFEPREANDGIEAWETLLIDPNIRLVLTDLTMPRLDGYGLLERIRGSRIARIRSIPVVVVSGAQDQVDQDRARAAGATDLINKGMVTAELLARLDVLARLESTQRAFELGLEESVRRAYGTNRIALSSLATLEARSQALLSGARGNANGMMMLTIRIGLQHAMLATFRARPPQSLLDAVGQLLGWSVRQSDCVAQTGVSEFTLITASVPQAGMHGFATRLCGAIATAYLLEDEQMMFVASGGLVSLAELLEGEAADPVAAVAAMRTIAAQRAGMGFERALSGVIGAEEARLFDV